MLWEWEEQTDLTAFKTLLRYKKAFIKTSEYVKHCEGTKQGCKGKAVPQLCAASTVSPSENTYTYPCPERADQPPQPSKQKQKDHMDSRAVAERKTNSTPQKTFLHALSQWQHSLHSRQEKPSTHPLSLVQAVAKARYKHRTALGGVTPVALPGFSHRAPRAGGVR